MEPPLTSSSTEQVPNSPGGNSNNGGPGSGGEGPIVCNACKQGLEETEDNTVVSFGKYLFHVDCRCAKCHNLVEHDTNLLLLSDGSPVCENCSYICSVCSKPIHNEAIVTGDESYHAECFRCRSCSNKIEELIFAKTTQGIWCMSCHNERVARTRKHAEAKRSRKEGGGGHKSSSSRSKGEREHRDRDRDREKSRDQSQSHVESQIPIRPLPASPSPNSHSNNNDHSHHHHRRIKTTPGDAPRHSPSIDLPPSSSAQSLNTTTTTHSRTPTSELPPPNSLNSLRGDRERKPSIEHSYFNERGTNSNTTTTPSELPPPHDAFRPPHYGGGIGGDGGSLSPKLPLESSSTSSRQGSLSAPPPGVDKSFNRRSGFYGRPSISDESSSTTTPVAAPETLLSKTPPSSSSSTPILPPPPPPPPPPHPSSPPPPAPSVGVGGGGLHGSMSFYDPDSLLFLSGIGSNPSSPKNNNSNNNVNGGDLPSIGLDEEEELLREGGGEEDAARFQKLSHSSSGGRLRRRPSRDGSSSSNSGSGGEEEEGGHKQKKKSEGGGGGGVAKKVRESIQLAKRESLEGGASGGNSGLDVELVEMLLGELEGTKKEMSDLQSKYNAFRRASRSAFEGFSMAREEYDKEVAARRETELEIRSLRLKFLEQAKRLAQVDQEVQQRETLKRRSKDLRNSVVGMEKHLSYLKTEVALSTAQVAELAALGKDESISLSSSTLSTTKERPESVPSSGTGASHDELASALNARLETVKDVHRDEINNLVSQKDDLLNEISRLKSTKVELLKENEILQSRNQELFEKHEEQVKVYESLLLDQSNKLRLNATTSTTNSGSTRHGHSPSSSSLLSNFTSTSTGGGGGNAGRSPLATARVIGSPSELSESFRFAKPEHVEASTRNKFKWGKGSSNKHSNTGETTSSSSTSGSSNSTGANLMKTSMMMGPPPPIPVAKSPTLNNNNNSRQGSIDHHSHSSKHSFQPVSILRPVRCDYCGDKMWGLNEVRCGLCGSYAHAKCSGYLLGGCGSSSNSGSGGGGGGGSSSNQDDTLNLTPVGPPIFGGDLIAQAKSEGRDVPLVVTKCIETVEAHGMTYEGIYRKTGGMSQTKLITSYFESKQEFDLLDRDKFNDLAAVTSCMKNYFRSLPNPLFTHDLHEEFVAAAELQDSKSRIETLSKVLLKLPTIHFETAKVLFQHLNRIQLQSQENKMTAANLGVVFGPTVLRSAVAAREWSDMGPKAKIVEILCDHADTLFTVGGGQGGESINQYSNVPPAVSSSPTQSRDVGGGGGNGRSLPLPPSDGK